MKKLNDFCVGENESIKAAITQIEKNRCRCVVVRNANNKVTAVLSEGDILRALLKDTDLHAPLKSIANPSFRYLTESEASIEKAAPILRRGITIVPVIDEKFQLVDVITQFDLFQQ